MAPALTMGATSSFDNMIDNAIRLLNEKLSQIMPDRPDLVLTPECCDNYFDLDEAERFGYYLKRGNKIRDFCSETAAKNRCYIGYSALRQDGNGHWRNSLQMIGRNGEVVDVYDKNHPTIHEIKHRKIKCGDRAKVMQLDFGTVACAICFDLNFAELRNLYIRQKPDIILFASMYHGGLMQAYWAYACRAFFAGSIWRNPSSIISPAGKMIATTTNYTETVTARINLDRIICHLDYNRDKFTQLKNKYGAEVTIDDPGQLGSVIVSSESDRFSAQDLKVEFGLEELDEYLSRSRQTQQRQ